MQFYLFVCVAEKLVATLEKMRVKLAARAADVPLTWRVCVRTLLYFFRFCIYKYRGTFYPRIAVSFPTINLIEKRQNGFNDDGGPRRRRSSFSSHYSGRRAGILVLNNYLILPLKLINKLRSLLSCVVPLFYSQLIDVWIFTVRKKYYGISKSSKNVI